MKSNRCAFYLLIKMHALNCIPIDFVICKIVWRQLSLRFLCVASAAHFFISGDNMSTAFLCGFIDKDYFSHFDIIGFFDIVKKIIEENNIDKIYHCRRTFFDI